MHRHPLPSPCIGVPLILIAVIPEGPSGSGSGGGSSGTLTTEEMALGETAAWDQVDLREIVIPGAFIA